MLALTPLTLTTGRPMPSSTVKLTATVPLTSALAEVMLQVAKNLPPSANSPVDSNVSVPWKLVICTLPPFSPVDPVGPCAPVGPVGPCVPVVPVGPVNPWLPVPPVGPCAPAGQAGPVSPSPQPAKVSAAPRKTATKN